MKWKTILLFSLSFLLIAGAFLVPPVLLRNSITRSISKTSLADASAISLKPAENTVEKLVCLADSGATTVQLGSEENVERLSIILQEELHALYAVGAIPQDVYTFLDEVLYGGFQADHFCVIQSEQHLMFEVILIHSSVVDAQFVFDYSTEKILGMNYGLYDNKLLALEYDESQAVRELTGWADYLDLKLGQITRTDLSFEELTMQLDSEADRKPVRLKQVILTDESGSGVPFFQTYTPGENVVENYSWGSY